MGPRTGFATVLILFSSFALRADDARFDLSGPPVSVKVERGQTTLPIAQVPNLMPGDRLWVHPDLPEDQAAHYLLIVTFLRGTTNPPPENWFTKAECWSKQVRQEGVFVTVPDEAQEALVFLAPETGGDFSTLRSAVRGRPGSFVRAVQDLDQASLDRQRLDTYLAAVRKLANSDPEQIHDVSEVLARSLNIHLEEDCFKKPVDEQASCLTAKGDDLVLSDGHSQSVVGALTNGSSADLIGQVSLTPQAGLGYFSPYVGAIMDIGRILDSLHTAHYQYIPALTLPKNSELQIKLNNPPSFNNPKSVIVIAMPTIRKQETPPLRPVNPELGTCGDHDPLVLAVQGAPLVFSTTFAHDLKAHIEGASGKTADVPVTADASKGGFVLSSSDLSKANLGGQPGDTLKATIQGRWGFDSFTGPAFVLQHAKEAKWEIPSTDTSGLLAGSTHVLHLHSPGAVCTESVSLKDGQGKELKVEWKVAKSDEVDVTIPAESAKESGSATMTVKQSGLKDEQSIPIQIFGEAAKLKQFTIIPGDSRGVLKGSDLAQVESVQLSGTSFTRKQDQEENAGDEVQLETANAPATNSLQPGAKLTAQVKLKDGRQLEVPVSVEAPRPRISLLTKSVELGAASKASAIHLANPNELPQDAILSFSVKADVPAAFSHDEKIEVATKDGSFHVLLGIEEGTLTLQDQQIAVARFEPAKSFGNSAFGPLQLRPVDQRGVKGDWIPLATLVRVPSLSEVDCPGDPNQQCTLKGQNLFLLAGVSTDPQFANPASVPQGFVGDSLPVPHPVNGTLYVKLRDDLADVNTANVPMPNEKQPAPTPDSTAQQSSPPPPSPPSQTQPNVAPPPINPQH